MNDTIIILAISVIIIGFLMLVGLALWLAAERRRSQSAAPNLPTQPLVSQPAKQLQQAVSPEAADQGPTLQLRRPAGSPATDATTAPAEGQADSAAPTGSKQQKGVHPSGEYPSAALYDQTLLPPPPKRRTRPQTK